ncbi:hypothetical protein CWS35_04800 [Bradyrhizobium sp. SK17]|nr:hypothetical protein CWS35_04800 [Bradyrhizobium sp. SK17]
MGGLSSVGYESAFSQFRCPRRAHFTTQGLNNLAELFIIVARVYVAYDRIDDLLCLAILYLPLYILVELHDLPSCQQID